MRSLLFTLALALAIPAASTATLAKSSGAGDDSAENLKRIVPRWLKAANIRGAAIAHIRDGKIETVRTFGESAPGVPLTSDAIFNVASLTKPVFASLVLSLVADESLTLDTPLATYWIDPDISGDERRLALTSRLTLSHQSGLPNWRRGKLEFLFTPGSRHEYSGEGYEYTRMAIENLTGESMPVLMRSRVLAKAGMTNSYFGWNSAINGLEVTGFDDAGQPTAKDGMRQFQPNAAAHLFTTIEDYARFCQWIIAGAGLPDELLEEQRRSQAQHAEPVEYFGLGWRLIRVGKETILSHDGREPGVRTQVFVLPDSREALVILTNSNQGELLTHPVVEATLRNGTALNRQIGVDTWRFLRSVPAEQMQQMAKGIARTPSFMSKLLYAVDASLIENAGLSPAKRARAHRAIDPFVLGMIGGQVSHEDAADLLEQLMETGASKTQLRQRLDAAQATTWLHALEAGARHRVNGGAMSE